MKIKLTSIIINSIADQLCSDLDPVRFLSQSMLFVCFFCPPSPFVTSKSNMATGTTPFSLSGVLSDHYWRWLESPNNTNGKMKGFFILVRSFQNSPKDPFLNLLLFSSS